MRGPPAGPRVLLRRLREIMAEPISAQDRLDKIVTQIAANMVAEVCSVYVLRADGVLELYATEGLKREAVHRTSLRVGQGLVGPIAEEARPLNLPDAQSHPAFRYLPETGEEIYTSFLGVPILRAGAHARRARRPEPGAPHLFRRGGRGAADHRDGARRDDRRRRARGPGAARAPRSTSSGRSALTGVALGDGVGARPRRAARAARRGHRAHRRGRRARRPSGSTRRSPSLRLFVDDMLSRGDIGDERRAPRRPRGLPHVRQRPRLGAPHARGDPQRPRRPRRRSSRCRATRARGCSARPTRSCASGCTISTTSPTGCCAC